MADTNAVDDYFANNQTAADARDQIRELLQQFGLDGLDNFVTNGIINGWSAVQTSQELRKTPEYQQRFKAIVNRQKAGLPAISEQDVINLERSYTQQMQEIGMPTNFYDQPEDFADFIEKDISPTEFQTRLKDGVLAWKNADPYVKQELQARGITDGEGIAFFLDPDKTEDIIMKNVTSAKIGGAAQRTGFGQLNINQADSLQQLGVTDDQAAVGFNDLASKRELMNTLPGEAGDNISQDDQIAAEFQKNADAQQKIKQRGEQRVAAFQNGTQFTSGKEGYAGLGKAR